VRQIFISYVSEDSADAHELAGALERASFSTWYYERDSLPGPTYLEQVENALSAGTVFVLLVSPVTVHSAQVNAELVRAHELGKSILPVLKGLDFEELRAQKRTWTFMLGGATACSWPKAGEGVEHLERTILAGLARLGVLPDHGRATATSAVRATPTTMTAVASQVVDKPRPRRPLPTLRIALGAIPLLALAGMGVWRLRGAPVPPAPTPPPAPAPARRPVADITRPARDPPPAARTYEIDVTVKPPRAEIELDGRPVGKGRLVRRLPAEGKGHVLRVSLDGFIDRTVEFDENVFPPANIVLRPQPARPGRPARPARIVGPVERDP